MKHKWAGLLRIFRYGLHNFRRNAWLTTAATLVMTVTLLIILATMIARFVFDDTINQVRQKIDVSVYLKDTATVPQITRFQNELQSVPIVTSVEYISKLEARQNFETQNKQEFERLQALAELGEENPFPATLRISTSDPNRLSELSGVINKPANKVLQSDEPSNTGPRREAIDRIANITRFLETAGLVAAVVFMAISVMIIFNTIRMAIFNRKDEIEIMKLIGADKSFIRGPFIVEAALYGILAAAFSCIVIYAVLMSRADMLAKYEIVIDPTIALFKQWPGPILVVLGQLALGILIGIFSSLLAMRRYLKI